MSDMTETPAPRKKTDLAVLEQQLAQEAVDNIKNAIAKPTGRKIGVKNKEFILPTGEIIGPDFNAVVVDFTSWNRYYTKPFTPQQPIPPVCFAHGKNLSELAPSPEAPEKQAEKCSSCPMNQFGSALTGRGKACKNTRELAIILEKDAADDDAPLYLLSVSPTAIRYFDSMVTLIQRVYNGPPIKAQVHVFLNNNTEFAQVVFDNPVPNPNLELHLSRRPEAIEMLSVEPDMSGYQPTPQARTQVARTAPPRATR